MKFFAFIMAVMVFALSVMPCMDDFYESSGKSKVEISKSASQQEHNDTDNCSPLCSCACCSASVIHQALFFNYLYKPACQVKKYFQYKPSFYSDISFSIWQPPKLG